MRGRRMLDIHRNTLQRKMVEYGLADGRARRKPLRANAAPTGRSAPQERRRRLIAPCPSIC